MNTRDPCTPAEWQDAVNAAETALMLDSARKYGLVTGGPDVNVDRCDDILRRGRKRGVTPDPVGVDAHVVALVMAGHLEADGSTRNVSEVPPASQKS